MKSNKYILFIHLAIANIITLDNCTRPNVNNSELLIAMTRAHLLPRGTGPREDVAILT